MALKILTADSSRDCNEIKTFICICKSRAHLQSWPRLAFHLSWTASRHRAPMAITFTWFYLSSVPVLQTFNAALATTRYVQMWHASSVYVLLLQCRIFTREESYLEVSRQLYLFTNHQLTDYRCQLCEYLVPVEGITAMHFGRCSQLSRRAARIGTMPDTQRARSLRARHQAEEVFDAAHESPEDWQMA